MRIVEEDVWLNFWTAPGMMEKEMAKYRSIEWKAGVCRGWRYMTDCGECIY